MLFSATQTRKVEDLARISLKKEPLYVGVDDNKDKATVDGLEQVLSHKLLHTGQIQRSQFPFHPFYWNPFSISWNHISFTRWSEITETARTQSSFSLLMQWSLSLSLSCFRAMWCVHQRSASCCFSPSWRRTARRSWWSSSLPACLWNSTMNCSTTSTCPSWPST